MFGASKARKLAHTGEAVTRCAEASLRNGSSVLPSAAVLEAIGSHKPIQSAICKSLDIDIGQVIASVQPLPQKPLGETYAPWHRDSLSLEEIARRAGEEARILGNTLVGPDHFVLAILSMHRDPTAIALRAAGVTPSAAYHAHDQFYGDDAAARRMPRSGV